MNLRDLRYIVAVADHAHFGRAAVACAVSQPTLSGQILKLEKELGVELFERVGKTIRLTNAGVPVLEHARRAVTAADDVLAAAAVHRDPKAAPLRLGIIPTLAPYLMPIVLPVVRERLQGLHLTLVEDLTSRLTDPILQGDLDAALIASEPNEAGLRDDVLFDEPFWLVMPKDHLLARQTTIAAADIDATALLLLRDGHCLRDQALALCERQDLGGRAMADMRATSLDTLIHMVDAGYGLTLMPHLAIARDVPLPKNLVARRLAGPQTSRGIRMVSRPGSARRVTIDRLAGLVRDCVADVMDR
ncbi:LysR substrate-binding domain-containing protein [Beijerinckia sp. L45]|uniref:LysR substrate-binding domain-containing protein n=1 Tax=Beijerinckia sp. L45 TaxID=1641855 RepID=UPI00131CE942|nr:LysR substrate-binding domain-containing protein [Beijerinckia sp. L45]